MSWQPGANAHALQLRASLNAHIRRFFAQRAVLEVETPVLSIGGNTDPNIDSFTTEFSGAIGQQSPLRWMRTSPEFTLKRLLAAGVGDCYELARVFRNGEAGRRHNPEFTLLEWYRVAWDHRRLMGETADLIEAALALVGKSVRRRELSYRELFVEHAGFDPLTAGVMDMRNSLSQFRIDPDGLDRDDWLHLTLTHVIEPTLPSDQLSLIYDFPASQAALARIRHDDPPVAERFEVYIGAIELANGYHELCDAAEQSDRFECDLAKRRARSSVEPAVDRYLIAALQHGMPACAGVALGVDRLLMAMLGTDDLREVLAFPFERA